jgi:hypothetical protein
MGVFSTKGAAHILTAMLELLESRLEETRASIALQRN